MALSSLRFQAAFGEKPESEEEEDAEKPARKKRAAATKKPAAKAKSAKSASETEPLKPARKCEIEKRKFIRKINIILRFLGKEKSEP